ncbi:transposase domain-containing protein [Streptomyces sp. NPDC020731]|uniref:transposase domain-containing protein n=1 Tax=Streptomyces sp. NPDC020731 TaxID=3365085 RepID=UPI0037AD7F97
MSWSTPYWTKRGRSSWRRRIPPSRVGVYLVPALGLFPHPGHAKVWNKLIAGLTGLLVVTPSEKALRDLRRRLGAAPLKALFEVVAGPLAQPRAPGTRYRQWRTVASDGCSSIKVPDGERNYAWLGRVRHSTGDHGLPDAAADVVGRDRNARPARCRFQAQAARRELLRPASAASAR